MLEREGGRLDAAIVACDWAQHVPVAKDALRAGLHVGLEAGGAASLQECYELLRVSEETGKHCMMLENCCYDRHEMAVLNMIRQGALGEIVHCECGYLHDLREEICRGKENRHYRLDHYLHRNCENYPTHGIGPVSKYLGINRGNRFISLVSMSSKARGLSAWVSDRLPPEHHLQGKEFRQGDVTVTMLKCAGGETVLCTLGTSLPRPYSRAGLVQGVRGIWMEEGKKLHLEGRCGEEEWLESEAYLQEFEHPLWKETLKSENHSLGHGNMDFLIMDAFLDTLRNASEPPIDIYDTVTWMAVTALSEESIALGSRPVAFPDFTCGGWINRPLRSEGKYAL